MDVEKELSEMKDMLSRLLLKVPNDETSTEKYGEFLLRWFYTYKKPNNVEHTSKSMFDYINGRILPAIGDIPLNALSGDRIQSFLNSIDCGNTQHKVALIINGSLTKAYKLRLIRFNPFDAVELKNYRGKHYRALTLFEQSSLYDYIYLRLYVAVYVILVCSGLRIGEFLALSADCFERKNRYIIVRRSVDIHSGVILERAKSYSSLRRVPYLPDLDIHIDYLLSYFSRKGCITYNQVKQFFKRAYKNLGFIGLNVHSFRHTFGCMCYRAGISPKLIQHVIGHASLDVTMNVYVDVLGDGISPFENYFKLYKRDLQTRPTDFWVLKTS